jgi:hypothetical protein
MARYARNKLHYHKLKDERREVKSRKREEVSLFIQQAEIRRRELSNVRILSCQNSPS